VRVETKGMSSSEQICCDDGILIPLVNIKYKKNTKQCFKVQIFYENIRPLSSDQIIDRTALQNAIKYFSG
jgi:hypothetical protein